MLWAALYNALGEPDGVREPYPTFDELIAEVKQLKAARDEARRAMPASTNMTIALDQLLVAQRVLAAVQADANVALEQRRAAQERADRLDARVTAAESEVMRAKFAKYDARIGASQAHANCADVVERVARALGFTGTSIATDTLVELAKAVRETLDAKVTECDRLREQLERVYNGCGNMMHASRAVLDDKGGTK